MNTKKIWAGIFAGAVLSVLSACLLPAGDGEGLDTDGNLPAPVTHVCSETSVMAWTDTSAQPTSFTADVQPIFNSKCTSCHAPGGSGYTATGGANNGLDLSAGASYAHLVNVTSHEEPTKSPFLRVQPGDPDCSYLYGKLTGAHLKKTSSGTASQKMPLIGSLSDAQIETIRLWILNGAAQ